MQRYLAFLLPVLLGGCGIANRIEANNEYRTSLENYKACLSINPATPQHCEGLRLAMEADQGHINTLRPGGTVRILSGRD